MKSSAGRETFLFYTMPDFYNYNGKLFQEGENFISPDSRAFRYGDGLFETILLKNGITQLASFHFERLFNGLNILKFEVPKLFDASFLQKQIVALCKKNNLTNARVRLSIFRGNGGLYDPENFQPNYVIQAWELSAHILGLNENGLVIDVYPDSRKTMDVFANIKSNNYLPYVMAAIYAKENKLNDCLVLNAAGSIADSTIANIFILKEDVLYTPSLTEGCVAGVMRRFLINNAEALGYKLIEKSIIVEEMEQADEIFLTNATYGLRWVKQFRQKEYTNTNAKIIYKRLMKALNNLSC